MWINSTGEIMEFAIVFIDFDGSKKSASIKAGSEHKAVELFAHHMATLT